MTNIVERLRNRQLNDLEDIDAVMREAADEIERLRNLAPIVREQGFEIEHLNEQCDIFIRAINKHAEEIAKLRADLLDNGIIR